MKKLHIISGLGSGGTERNLSNLVNFNKKKNIVFSFKKENFYLNSKKVKIFFPKNQKILSIIKHILSIPKILKREKPDIIYCWMNYANVIGGFLSYINGFKKIIWNIRSSGDEIKILDKNFLIFINLIIFSYFIPKKIIFNSRYSLQNHKKKFLNKSKFKLIYNGFFLKKIKKKKVGKKIIFLCIARYHAIKNHYNLLNSFLLFNQVFNNWQLILIGKDILNFQKKIKLNIKYKNLLKKIKFKEHLNNVDNYYYKSHYHILVSNSESFPNVIGESLSCGTPCISNNVGDCNVLIKNNKFLCKSNKPLHIFKKLKFAHKLFKNKKQYFLITKKCRTIVKNFSINKMIENFEKIENEI